VTLNPPKLSNCGNLTHLVFLFPKCPHQFSFFKKKKIQTGWPATTYRVVWPPQHIFIFFGFFLFLGFFFCFLRKNVMGHFGNNKVKWVKLPQFETLGGVKCHFLNFGGKSENRWILQGGKM
jgi:hypothetical protein